MPRLLPKIITAACCLIVSTSPVFAQSQTDDIRPYAKRLNSDQILQHFKGITHEGAYGFSRDGKPSRRYVETHNSNGRVTYTDNGDTETGIWFIANEKLCFNYDSNTISGGCFRVYQIDNCFYYYSDQFQELPYEIDQDYWTARSVKKGQTAECTVSTS